MRGCLWYSFVQLFKDMFMSILTTIMLAVGMILTCYAGVTYMSYHHVELVARQYVSYDMERVYHINFLKYIYAFSDDEYQIKELYQYIRELPEVDFCGFYYYALDNMLCISPDLASLCGISLDSEDGVYSAWVGARLVDRYPVGSKVDDGHTRSMCTVKGVLEPGSSFLSDNFLTLGDMICIDDYIVVDADALIDRDIEYFTNGLINNFYFCVRNEEDADYVKTCIEDKAKSLQLDVYGVQSLEFIFEENARNAMGEAGEQYYMPVTVLLCSCLGMLLATMISYKRNKRDCDIMLLNGYTRKNLACIFFLQNVYKTAAAYAATIFYWYNSEEAIEYAGTLNIAPLLIAVGVIGVCLVWLSSLPILVKFKISTPMSLVSEEV